MIGNYVITKVLMAATDVRLTTKEHVRDDLQITDGIDDVFLDRLIVQESSSAAAYCNRSFAMQTYQDTFRWERGTNGYALPNMSPRLMTRKDPLTSVTSIMEGDNLLVVDVDYEIDFERGFIYRLDSDGNPRQWPARKTVLVYDAGWTLPRQGADGEDFTLPLDVEQAVIRMVKARYLGRTRDPLIKSQEVPGVLSTTFWIPNGDTGNLPPDIADVLDNYRIPAIG